MVLRVVQARRLAPPPDLLGVLLLGAVGNRFVRRVRDLLEQRVACRLGLRERGLEALELLLHPLELLDLLRRRLAGELLAAAQVVDLRDERAPALVGGEELVERVGRALARDCGAHCVGVVPRCAEVDHEWESKKASRT